MAATAAFRYYTAITKMKPTKCHLLQFDGNANPNPGIASCGGLIYSPFTKGKRIPLIEIGTFMKTDRAYDNNQSEFIALKAGLETALKYEIYDLVVEGDSKYVIDCVTYNTTSTWPKIKFQEFFEAVEEYLPMFDTLAFRHISRKENKAADAIAREAFETQTSFVRELEVIPKKRKASTSIDGSRPAKKRKLDIQSEAAAEKIEYTQK